MTATILFAHVFEARCVRVLPTRRVGEDTAIRFELLGCRRFKFVNIISHPICKQKQLSKKYVKSNTVFNRYVRSKDIGLFKVTFLTAYLVTFHNYNSVVFVLQNLTSVLPTCNRSE